MPYSYQVYMNTILNHSAKSTLGSSCLDLNSDSITSPCFISRKLSYSSLCAHFHIQKMEKIIMTTSLGLLLELNLNLSGMK